jgi:lipopolysaccharide transport system permease protein
MNHPANNAVSTVFESSSGRSALEFPKHARQLPADPVTRIQPPRFWERIDFAELWAHREVLYFLMWRDLKVRYKQTILGAAWVILQPLLITAVFAIFLGRLIKVPSDGVPYPIFAYAALLLWTFVSNAVLSSTYSLVVNSQIITRVYFSRLMIPAAAVGVRVVDLLIASVVLVGLMLYYRVPISSSILMFPVFVVLVTVLTFAIGVLGASLNVRYRDVGTVLPILLQVWMFVSPVVYSSSILPQRLRLLYSLNPLVGIINGFRASLFHLPFDWPSIIMAVIVTLPLLVVSVHLFRRMESSFADDV